MEKMRIDKGITLIALIITVIVLLILAGITITTLTGENGILSNATKASTEHKRAEALEEIKIAMEGIKIEKLAKGEKVTLDTFIETTKNPNLNLLESKLYDSDKEVDVTKNTLENNEDILEVFYKNYEFIISGDLSITIAGDIQKISLKPSIKDSTITSLTIRSEITGAELSEVTGIYYSCDDGKTWKDSGNATEYVYNGLLAGTDYSVKVKIIVNNKKEIISDSIIGATKSTADIIAKMPTDFFITTDSGATISGINGNYIVNNEIVYDGFDGILVIPTKWNNVNITNLANAAITNKNNLQTLYIEEGLKEIGDNPFNGCKALAEVTLPTSLETLGNRPFINCTNITKITIPQLIINDTNTVKSIFSQSYSKIEEVNYNGEITYIGRNAFEGCIGLKDINVPETVTIIKYYAFQGCTGLTNVTIPGNVKTIERAFNGCTGMTDLTIKSGVETIGAAAFDGCTKLNKLTMEEGVKEIQSSAFNRCIALTEVTLPASLEVMGSSPFINCTNITKITVKKSANSLSGSPWGASNATVIWEP